MTTNKHGLNRDVPAHVQREVRKECGNGCVVCGLLPYHYEHFEPPFNDATEHRSSGIALLCPTHHLDRTAGRLSVEAVRRARDKPFNAGRSAVWSHHLTENSLLLNVGTNVLQGANVGLSINGHIVFGLRAPASTDGQWLVTGSFSDHLGHETLQFRDNQVVAMSGSWDVLMEGPTITVRAAPGEIVAQVSFRPEDRIISMDRLQMRLSNGHFLKVDSTGLSLHGPMVNVDFGGNLVTGAVGSVIQFGRDGPAPADFATVAFNYDSLGGPEDWRK